MKKEFDDTYIDLVFGQRGILEDHKFAYREPQIKLARTIENWFRNGKVGVADAPTGIGKTLAYLIVALYRAVVHKERTIIATKTINLQKQIIEKDLPKLEEILGEKFDCSLLKGMSNFVCLAGPPKGKRFGPLSVLETTARAEVQKWVDSTRTGDRDDSPHGTTDNVWRRFSRSSNECDYGDCEYYGPRDNISVDRPGGCFSYEHKTRAKSAKVIVTNFHMLYAHMKFSTPDRSILPKFHYLVLDEAHDFAEDAREVLGDVFSINTVRKGLDHHKKLQRYDRRFFQKQIGDLRRHSDDLFFALKRYYNGASYDSDKGYFYKEAKLGGVDPSAFLDAIERIAEREKELRLGWAFQNMRDRALITFGKGGEVVRWIEGEKSGKRSSKDKEKGSLRLVAAPMLMDEEIQSLFKQATKGVVCLSATMSLGGTLDYCKAELGHPSAEELIVDTSFPYSERVYAVVAHHMAVLEPGKRGWTQSTWPLYREILDNWDHRILVLCTSNKDSEDIGSFVAQHAQGRNVFRQNAGRNTSDITSAFQQDETSILIGVKSLWQGLNVKGPKVVVIHRLPFHPFGPADYAVEKQLGRVVQWNRYVSMMLRRLKQGIGRLMRSERDCGLIVIMDSRTKTRKSYKDLINHNMPPFKMSEYSGKMKELIDDCKSII